MAPEDSPDNRQTNGPVRLNGWKEIAAHFGKGVRTVQRWEVDLDLPIHRIDSVGGEIVYALRHELDAWEASRVGRRRFRHNGDVEASNGSSGGDDTREAKVAADASRGAGAPPAPVPAPPPRRGRWLLPAAFLALGLLLGGTLIWLGSLYFSRSSSGQPQTFRIVAGKLAIFDENDRFLWDKAFDVPLTASLYDTEKIREEELTPVDLRDVDADGNVDVLFVHEPWSKASQGLYCFDHRGNEVFHRPVDRAVTYDDGLTYAGPWRGVFVFTTAARGKPGDIWFVATHEVHFPTVLLRYHAGGNLLGEYWVNGQISKVVVGDVAGRRLVFVGAVNNETGGASLSVLDADRPTGSAPAADPEFRCTGASCTPGEPIVYLVFRRLDIARAANDYSDITNINVQADGQILVQVRHRPDARAGLPPGEAATTEYYLDARLQPVRADLGSRLGFIHGVMLDKGLLDHAFDEERYRRQLWPVLRWSSGGYEKLQAPEPK